MKCKSVNYCDAACQRQHWPGHKKACKAIAAAREAEESKAAAGVEEAKEDSKPPAQQTWDGLGDCPICLEALTFDNSIIFPCCCKHILSR